MKNHPRKKKRRAVRRLKAKIKVSWKARPLINGDMFWTKYGLIMCVKGKGYIAEDIKFSLAKT